MHVAQVWMEGLGSPGPADHEYLMSALEDVQLAGQLHLGKTLGPRWASPGRAGQLHPGGSSKPGLS